MLERIQVAHHVTDVIVCLCLHPIIVNIVLQRFQCNYILDASINLSYKPTR
jgi:hypothetical protein